MRAVKEGAWVGKLVISSVLFQCFYLSSCFLMQFIHQQQDRTDACYGDEDINMSVPSRSAFEEARGINCIDQITYACIADSFNEPVLTVGISSKMIRKHKL